MKQKSGVSWPSIPFEEYRERIAAARRSLADHGIDAMVLFSPTNWWYYGGFGDAAQMHNGIWRTALVVSQEHDPVAVADTALMWALAHTSWVEDVRYHSGSANPAVRAICAGDSFYPLLFDTMRGLGLDRGTLGLETGPEIATYLSIDEYHRIRETLPHTRLAAADDAIFAQRMIKTPYEQDLMREGCRRACLCVQAAFEAIRPGVSEREVHRVFWRTAVELDLVESPYQGNWLCFTSNAQDSIAGHRWITGPVNRIIQRGDWGNTDCGPTYKMYQLDFQRAFSVGEPSAQTRRYYEIAREAHVETLAQIRPGVRFGELFERSRQALLRRGGGEHPITFIGHGEGLANHEPPWIVAHNDAVVRPAMVLAIEIGAFDPEGVHFGGMPEDVLLVTENGVENLTRYLSHELYIAG